MASAGARAARNREVRQRLDAALSRIGKRLDIAIPPAPRRAKDPLLQPILELERFALFAERVEGALGDHANEGEAPGGYDSLTVAMLREEIARRGLNAPSGAVKADLVAILEEADAAPNEEEPEQSDESEDDADDDEGTPL